MQYLSVRVHAVQINLGRCLIKSRSGGLLRAGECTEKQQSTFQSGAVSPAVVSAEGTLHLSGTYLLILPETHAGGSAGSRKAVHNALVHVQPMEEQFNLCIFV